MSEGKLDVVGVCTASSKHETGSNRQTGETVCLHKINKITDSGVSASGSEMI